MKSYLGVVGEKLMFLGSGCDFSSELRDRIISCYLKWRLCGSKGVHLGFSALF